MNWPIGNHTYLKARRLSVFSHGVSTIFLSKTVVFYIHIVSLKI